MTAQMAAGFRRAASIGSILCVTLATLSASPAATWALQPVLEMAVQEGRVDFGEVSPASSPRTLPDAVYIAVKTQRAGPWNLTVSATGDFSAGEGGPTFPIGNLEVAGRLNGQPAPFQRVSTSPVTLVSNGPATGGTVAVDYRLSIGYDAPVPATGAEYRSGLVYTTSFGTLAASYVEPNPFDPTIHQAVAIKYYYSRLAYPYVVVRISDSQGQAVYTRSFPRPPDGWYVETWDGRDISGHPVPDGVYSYSITGSVYVIAGGYINVQRGMRGAPAPNSAAIYHAGALLQLSAWVRPHSAVVGDVVTIGASLRNASPFDLAKARVAFDLPTGLRPVAGTGASEDGPGRPITMTPTATGVSWDLGTLEREASVRFSFKAAVGPDARPMDGALRARASAAFGRLMVKSREVSIPLVIESGVEANYGAIVGRVFMDRNADGRMNEGDQPAQGVLVAIDDAETARSDAAGRFIIEGLGPGDHVMQVAEQTLPPGWESRSTLIPVSVASGETVRLDIPLQQIPLQQMDGLAPGSAAPPSPAISGTKAIKLEMGPGYTSWQASGKVAAQTETGLELSLSGEKRVTYMTDEGANGPTTSGPEAMSSGRVTLAAPLAKNARLVMGLSAGSETSRRSPALNVGVEVIPMLGLKLTGGYDAAEGSPWVSGAWEQRLTDALTVTAGGDISRNGEKMVIAPLVSFAYAGPSGVTGRFAVGGASHLAAELACSLPLGRGLSLSLTHRRHIGETTRQGQSESPADTIVGLWCSPGGEAPFTVAAQYEPANGRLRGSLLLAGNASGGGSWRANLRASFGPRWETLSLRASVALPGRLETVGILTCEGERQRLETGSTVGKLTTAVSCSVVLDERTCASGLLSLKQVDDTSPPVPVHAVTRSIAAYFDRRVAPRLSLGAGGSWTHLDPGGLFLATVDARTAYDITPRARLVLGYRTTLVAAGSSPMGTPWPQGPYVRLVLASGWDSAAPDLYDLR